jgi:type II secretory pathway component PulK
LKGVEYSGRFTVKSSVMGSKNRESLTTYEIRGSAERGAILILVMLVLLVLSTVVLQIWFSADVDRQIALYQKTYFPIRQAANGAFMKACSTLNQDMQQGGSSDEEGDSTSGGDDGGDLGDGGDGSGDPGSGDPGLGDGGDGGGDGGGLGFGGDDAGNSNVDSLIDSWARPGEIALAFSSGVEVEVIIRDEDAKFNILAILSKDEEFREKSMERLVRVIDLFREGMKGDLGRGDALDIANSLKEWMKGERKETHFPRPMVKTGEKDEERDRIGDDSIDFPLTMEELVMCDSITKDTLFGYIDNRVRIPGLIEYITVYSNLVMDEVKKDQEDDDSPGGDESDPFDGSSDDDAFQDTPDDEDGEGEEEVATETNNGLINVNTAPLPVLKALMDNDELSYAIIDEIGEFRDKAVEKYLDELEDLDWDDQDARRSFFNREDDEDEEDGEDKDDASKFSDDDEDEDFIFKDPYEIFERVEEYFDTTFDVSKDAQAEFASLLTVKSNVFTVYIRVKTSEGRDSQTYRAVVWRRGSEGGGSTSMSPGDGGDPSDAGGTYTTSGSEEEAQIITLVPLEPYPHPIPFREGEEEELESFNSYY